jgi:hypothetical protein
VALGQVGSVSVRSNAAGWGVEASGFAGKAVCVMSFASLCIYVCTLCTIGAFWSMVECYGKVQSVQPNTLCNPTQGFMQVRRAQQVQGMVACSSRAACMHTASTWSTVLSCCSGAENVSVRMHLSSLWLHACFMWW